MAKAAEEIRSLTGIRGAAAVAVMVYHFHLNMPSAGLVSTVLNHGYLSLDLFFVLSGFVMVHMYGDAVKRGAFQKRDFIGHRFVRFIAS